MLNKGNYAHSNLAMLEYVARKLGSLKDELVFLGGCVTSLYITDSAVPDIRTTLNVDCIVDVASLSKYYQLEERLTKKGFKKSTEDNVICRWYYEDAILDVMPADEKIIGFSNRWYKAGIEHAVNYKLSEDIIIKILTAPYFIATKLEAFKTRGNGDYMSSHDFEDIISIVDGDKKLFEKALQTDVMLKDYLKEKFRHILQDQKFYDALPGHLNYGSVTVDRVKIILQRIKNIINV